MTASELRSKYLFEQTEEVDGHLWGKFLATSLLGGMPFECCFRCGMIRRKDKQNKPCRGQVRVGPRSELMEEKDNA